MNRGRSRLAGIIGTILLIFALVCAAIQGAASKLAFLHLIPAVLLLSFWFIGNGRAWIRNHLFGSVLEPLKAGRTILYMIILLGGVISINWLVSLPQWSYRVDLTADGLKSLSEQSINLARGLTHPLELVAFVEGSAGKRRESEAKSLLDLYRYYSDLISVQIIDPLLKPELFEKYGMKAGEVLYIAYDRGEGEKLERRLARVSELVITANLSEILKASSYRIYYIIGHGEPDLRGETPAGLKSFELTLSKERFLVQPLFLGASGKIPDDAAVLILLSPTKALLEEEHTALLKYVQSGGRLLLMHDPNSGLDDVKRLALSLGIEIGDNVVIDLKQRLSADTEPVVRRYAPHPITERFTSQDVTVFTLASTVKRSSNVPTDGVVTELLYTAESAWGETNLAAIFGESEPIVNIESDELSGSLPLAATYEKKLGDKFARVIVFGDSDWIQNSRLKLFSNRDLLLNSISWVAGDEGSIVTRPKVRKFSEFPLTHDSMLTFLALTFLLPELVVILGVYSWWRRSAAAVI